MSLGDLFIESILPYQLKNTLWQFDRRGEALTPAIWQKLSFTLAIRDVLTVGENMAAFVTTLIECSHRIQGPAARGGDLGPTYGIILKD